jgi:hypothetical protein
MKEDHICLICSGIGIDKALKVGEKSSTGNVITHLCMHPKENEEYMKANAKAKEESNATKDKSLKTTLKFPVLSTLRDNFFNACVKWVVADFQPLNAGESKFFKAMIKATNPSLNSPDTNTLKKKLHLTKATASANMKIFLKGKSFSVTIDHWTSIAIKNYAALTLHMIDHFVLKSFTLPCVKHEGGSMATEMDDLLSDDLDLWELSADKFVAMVTDTALNITQLVRKMSGGEFSLYSTALLH